MYSIELMPKAIKDIKKLPKQDVKNILDKIKSLESGLGVNVKKLTNYTPEYRLRVGHYRVLFTIQNNKILIYHIKHRKNAYIRR